MNNGSKLEKQEVEIFQFVTLLGLNEQFLNSTVSYIGAPFIHKTTMIIKQTSKLSAEHV